MGLLRRLPYGEKGGNTMILVTGGAGFIGSHMVKTLLKEGYDVLVFDNLSTGHKESLPNNVRFIQGDLRDKLDIEEAFKDYPIKAVMHFAANCYVGESVEYPSKYYRNNMIGLMNLLDAMLHAGVQKIIFSSSCAVYGDPSKDLINEETVPRPISPYGRTKLFCEEIIKDYSHAYGTEYIFLRYFNVAGADLDGKLGEDHDPETHLIPSILNHFQGKKDTITVYGKDYDTPDLTCIRDYIHVTDLVLGHLAALTALFKNSSINETYNLGRGEGYSIKEIIRKCEEITGHKAVVSFKKRRPGDPPRLIADSKKARRELKWKAALSLEDMIRSAWVWFVNHPNGYKKIC